MFTTRLEAPRLEWRKPARRARAATPAANEQRWSARRTLAFVTVTNAAAWWLIVAGIRAL